MNLLIHDPPTELEVGGIFYPIDAHYRNCLTIIAVFEDKELTRNEQLDLMLEWLFTKVPGHPDSAIPMNREAALYASIDFLNCGEALNPSKDGALYSFSQDAKYIRSAIEKSHRLSLEEVGFLHWWKFIYMFFDLDKDCFFNQLVSLRQRRKYPKLLTKEEKQYIADHPELFNLSQHHSMVDQDLNDEIDARYKAAVARRKEAV